MNTVSLGGTANANFQNKINISIVFHFLRNNGPAHKALIARALGLSAPAVGRSVEQLLQQGYLVESGIATTESGKKVTQIGVNAQKGAVIAVDLLKGQPKFGLYDLVGNQFYLQKSRRVEGDSDITGFLFAEIERLLTNAERRRRKEGSKLLPPVESICVGVPAAVDSETGEVTGASLFQSLSRINIKLEIEQKFNVRCFVENDVKLAAFGENRLGEGKAHRNLVYVDINDGIGAGIIMDNRILRGAQGLAGEIGYALSSSDEALDGTGPRGHLENYASIEAIGRAATKEIDGAGRTILETIGKGATVPISPKEVFAAALKGNAYASSLVSKSVDKLGVVFHNLILTVNPEVVVIGGDICDMPGVEQLFLSPLTSWLETSLPFVPPEIHLSSLGAEACIRGAALFATESLLSGKYPFSVG
ncbi:MAG: ROK family transcriptional regulator [Balneolaceae bacterium]